MKRRDFILSALAGISVVSVATYFVVRDVEFSPELAQPQSLLLILGPQEIKDIGKRYRETTPGESGARSLVKLLDSKSIDESITNDFETGQTVIVDGWVLSVTEARQCALASTLDTK